MFGNSCVAGEVTDFRKLGTGHKRRKVFVVDQNRWIIFSASVFQNRPRTQGCVLFDNGRKFYVRSRTVDKKEVSLYLWTEELEYQLRWQCEIEKIEGWMESAKAEDVMVLGECVAQESGRSKWLVSPEFECFARPEIKKQLLELGLVQLQKLGGMLFSVTESIAA